MSLNEFRFVKAIGVGAVLWLTLPAAKVNAVSTDRPKHILLLMCDQYRFDALGSLGNPLAVTPTLDQLAAQGTLFARAYCQNPVCVPSRTSILLGRYSHSTGVFANRDTAPRDQVSFTQILRQNDYQAACFGKLHVAGRDRLDWDEYQFQRERPIALPGKPPPLTGGWPAGKPLGQPASFEDKYHHEVNAKNDTIEFIEKHQDQPWFIQCSFVKPHNPFNPPQRFWDMIDRSKIVIPRYPLAVRGKSLVNPFVRNRLSTALRLKSTHGHGKKETQVEAEKHVGADSTSPQECIPPFLPAIESGARRSRV